MRLTQERTKRIDVPNDPDNGFINIKALSMEKISKIEAKASTTSISSDGEGVISIDTHKRTTNIASACLVGWGNFFDETGKEIKFSRANIHKVAECGVMIDKQMVRFLSWVDEEHSKFLEEVEAETEVAEKN